MITKACAEDIDAILKIERMQFSAPWSKALFDAELTKSTSIFLTYKIDEHIVGYVVAYNLGVEAEIADIAVHPDFLGQGLGVALLNAVFKRLNESTEVFLEVATENTAAIQLYRKVGFSDVAVRKNYYGAKKNALVMKLIYQEVANAESERCSNSGNGEN